MFGYILKRIFNALFIIIGTTFFSFLLIKLSPGSYIDQLFLNPSISKETIEKLKESYGLNKPFLIQYFMWLKNAISFNLGYSFMYHEKVIDLIRERVVNTLFLSVSSFIFSWFIGISLGIIAAFKKDSLIDKALNMMFYISISVPSFLSAFISMVVAIKLGFPIGGVKSVYFDELSFFGKVKDILEHLFVPLSAIVFSSFGYLGRLTRANVIDFLNSELYKFYLAYSLPRKEVIKRTVRNALKPFITLLGYEIASLISGAGIVEVITNWPGMGLLIFNGVLSKDIFLVMGSLYIGVIMLIIGNLIADILIVINDPKVRLKEVS